jgi:hypothetical protein
MRDLNYELKQLLPPQPRRQLRARSAIASACSTWWPTSSRRRATGTWLPASLKPKHVEGLVERWQAEGLAVGTIKNRMAELRWWAEKIGKQQRHRPRQRPLRHRQPAVRHQRQQGAGTAGGELARITDPYTAMSLRLQAAFGLRRGESIKIRPEWADRGDRARAEGHLDQGRPRRARCPIRNAEQRQVLDEAKALAGRGSLIPAERSLRRAVAPLRAPVRAPPASHRVHGFRHQYAQVRYRELTGLGGAGSRWAAVEGPDSRAAGG